MQPKRVPRNNFICDPDGPNGPVFDSSLHEYGFTGKYRFIECSVEVNAEDEEIVSTIKRLRKNFTQFKGSEN